MADYTQITDFSAKDALSTGDPEKLILGADFDGEFTALATAISSKYDSTDIASQAEAEAETVNTKLITPLRVAQWADANGGIVGDLQALAAPAADRLLMYDFSGTAAVLATLSTGLTFSGTVLTLDSDLQTISGLAKTDGNFIVGNGSAWVAESGSTARTSLGLGSIATQASSAVTITGGSITGITDLAVADGGTGSSTASGARTALGVAIGTDVQAFDAHLQDIANIAPPTVADQFLVSTAAGTYALESGSTVRGSLGLGSIATQASSSVTITGGSITGITDLAVADGGTGASTAAGAATSLGLGTGNSPQFAGINVGHATDTTIGREAAGHINVEGQTVAQHGTGQVNANYASADIFFSDSAPVSEGANGDMWFEY